MKKQITVLALIAVCVGGLSLTGCKGKGDKADKGDSAETTTDDSN